MVSVKQRFKCSYIVDQKCDCSAVPSNSGRMATSTSPTSTALTTGASFKRPASRMLQMHCSDLLDRQVAGDLASSSCWALSLVSPLVHEQAEHLFCGWYYLLRLYGVVRMETLLLISSAFMQMFLLAGKGCVPSIFNVLWHFLVSIQ